MHNYKERGTFKIDRSFVFARNKISISKTLRRQKVSIPECDLTGRRVTVDLLPVGSHSGIHDSSTLEIQLQR